MLPLLKSLVVSAIQTYEGQKMYNYNKEKNMETIESTKTNETAQGIMLFYFGDNKIVREISPDEPCFIFHSGGFFFDNLSLTQNGHTAEYGSPNVANIITSFIFMIMMLFIFSGMLCYLAMKLIYS